MLNGKISETLRYLSKVFRRLQMTTPQWDRRQKFYLYVRILDLLLLKRSSKVFRRFHTIYSALKVRKYSREEAFHPVTLYHLGQSLSLTYDTDQALSFHLEALRMSLSGQATPDAVLRTLGDHAILIGYLGFRKIAYLLLDTVLISARELGFKETFGYLLVQRTLTLDHLQGKFEDFKQNTLAGLNCLSFEKNQQILMQGIVFQLYQSLLDCDQSNMKKLMRLVPIHLRTRHWLSPRAISIYIFSLLLQDAREQIVLHKSYIRRRQQVGARRTGLFVSMIEAMINFASGEPEKAFASYLQVLKYYHLKRKSYLYPYEEDYVFLFIVFFPAVIQHEYQYFQLNLRGAKEIFQKILERSNHKDFGRRPIPVLVIARIEEMFGYKTVKTRYDASMKAGRFAKLPLVEILTHFWFGRHLLQDKQFHRRDYIYQTLSVAKEKGLSLIAGMAISLLEEHRFEVPATIKKKTVDEPKYTLSLILADALNLTAKVFDDRISQTQALSSQLRLLRKSYRYHAVHIVLGDHLTQRKPRPFSSEKRDSDTYGKIISYVKSYFTIRSALFIPLGDAPWLKDLDLSDAPSYGGAENSRGDDIDLEMTQQLDEEDDIQSTLILEGTLPNAAEDDFTKIPAKKIRIDPKSPGLNTIIPMKDNGVNIGVILLERVEIAGGDSAKARTDLDYFGAYMGLWLRYSGMAGQSSPPQKYKYLSGEHYLEPCNWLHIWAEGNLRARRESTWYLGVNTSPTEYMVIYCRLNGPELDRELISSQLWYHSLAVRSLVLAKNKDGIPWEDLYEEIMKVIGNISQAKRLEGIAVSYSIFNQKKRTITSGHFGPSRPVVMGVENEVIPQNKVVMSLSHGRALRFWKVCVEEAESGVFIQTHDSSVLDGLNVRQLRQSEFFQSSLDSKRRDFAIYLKQLLVAGQVPRYFVAAVFADSMAQLKALEKAN